MNYLYYFDSARCTFLDQMVNRAVKCICLESRHLTAPLTILSDIWNAPSEKAQSQNEITEAV